MDNMLKMMSAVIHTSDNLPLFTKEEGRTILNFYQNDWFRSKRVLEREESDS